MKRASSSKNEDIYLEKSSVLSWDPSFQILYSFHFGVPILTLCMWMWKCSQMFLWTASPKQKVRWFRLTCNWRACKIWVFKTGLKEGWNIVKFWESSGHNSDYLLFTFNIFINRILFWGINSVHLYSDVSFSRLFLLSLAWLWNMFMPLYCYGC